MKGLADVLPVAVLIALEAMATALSFGGAASAAALQQETRAVAAFHRIEIDGQVNVTLIQGATESVSVEAEQAALPRIRTEVHGDTLSIDAEVSRTVWQWFSGRGAGRTPRITIHLKDVDRIEVAGSVTLDADSL